MVPSVCFWYTSYILIPIPDTHHYIYFAKMAIDTTQYPVTFGQSRLPRNWNHIDGKRRQPFKREHVYHFWITGLPIGDLHRHFTQVASTHPHTETIKCRFQVTLVGALSSFERLLSSEIPWWGALSREISSSRKLSLYPQRLTQQA